MFFLAHPLDGGIEMPPPSAHALLVCAAVAPARDLGPASTILLDQMLEEKVLLHCPLLLTDVGVDLNGEHHTSKSPRRYK